MSDRPCVVLGHYDNETLSAYRAELEGAGFRVQATSSGLDVLKRFEAQSADAIVLDALLPRLNGLSVLKSVKEHERSIPVVMVLDEGDTYTENRALICGADGLVKRDAAGELPDGALAAKVRSLLSERSLGSAGPAASDRSEELQRLLDTAARNLREENPVLAHITDQLTGLYNAEYLEIKLGEEFKRTRRFGHPLTVLDIQLHRADGGDERDDDSEWRHVLNEVAGLLLCESRDIDVLSRVDDSTFRLLLPHTSVKGAESMVERILGTIAERSFAAGEPGSVSAASGLAEYSGEGVDSAEDLKRRTSEALRQAWRSGGSCHVVWSADVAGGA